MTYDEQEPEIISFAEREAYARRVQHIKKVFNEPYDSKSDYTPLRRIESAIWSYLKDRKEGLGRAAAPWMIKVWTDKIVRSIAENPDEYNRLIANPPDRDKWITQIICEKVDWVDMNSIFPWVKEPGSGGRGA